MANSISDAGRRHFITPAMAKEMIKRFSDMKDKLLRPEYAGKDILPFSETFDKTAIQALLDQPGCVKFRAWTGMKENLEIRFIFVGVNEKDQDMMPADTETDTLTATSETDDFFIVEEGTRCPPDCPPPPPPPPFNEL